MNSILLVEDELAIAKSLKEILESEGFVVSYASGQKEAETQLNTADFSLALLDVSLREGSGYFVCEQCKAKKIPVIFLTASADEGSVVKGLDMGADDYIAKPFRPKELVSRIKNVLRRYGDRGMVVIGNVSVDTQRGSVSKNGVEVNLSALEYRLLSVFINNRGKLLTRNRLLDEIWDMAGDFVNDNTLTVYIKRLREKIEDDPQNPVLIQTVRGLGYRMD